LKVLIASKNDGKIKEIKSTIDLRVDFLTYQDVSNWPQVRETGQTFQENALIKAHTLASKYNIAVLSDDSGLEVDALDGKPGVYSSRYVGARATDKRNVEKLLKDLHRYIYLEKRSARFRCVAIYFDPKKNIELTAEGKVEGSIGFEPVGENGFGYDPVFIPKGYNATMAQLSLSEKNAISHRGKALKKMKKLLQQKVST